MEPSVTSLQVNINLTSQLDVNSAPLDDLTRDMSRPENRTAEPYDLAIVDTHKPNRSGFPTYITNLVNTNAQSANDKADNPEFAKDKDIEYYGRYKVLGAVLTSTGGSDSSVTKTPNKNQVMPFAYCTILNTGPEIIRPSEEIYWTPPMSIKSDGTKFTEEEQIKTSKVFSYDKMLPGKARRATAIVRPLRARKETAKERMRRRARLAAMNAIIGRSVSTAKPGEMLTIQLAVS